MKIAYGNYGMPHTPWDLMVRQIAEIGYVGLELCVGPDYSTAPERLDSFARRQLRQLLGDASVELGAFIVVGARVLEPDPSQHAANLDRLQHIFELGHELGVARPIVSNVLGGKPEDWESQQAFLLDRVGDWARTAAEQGGVYAFEPHVGSLVHTPDRALWLLGQINRPSLRVNFDYSHFEAEGLPLQAAIDHLLPYAANVHVKDVQGTYPNHRFLLPGEGKLDYADYVRRVAAAGYDGQITVEISAMVFKAPGYDPLAAARFSYQTLDRAFRAAGLR